ncbi:uncharacterized GPI-anchored protein At1g61900 isoform X2 [Punica granatum]|uniref:Uncharacterized GPI-anchored protein At1g61900 isoform X2 n=1 Tax=Punica granatum TaxID=22663 RepID=A0A6P8DFG9_PUNGR|nr:uncharacterized GPI-anchored protein At1g61900 isoform X2 [Punica granatum]
MGVLSLSPSLRAHFFLLLLLFLHGCCCSPLRVDEAAMNPLIPEISPSGSPQPFLPLPSPSPLSPFTNSTAPKLSGLCALNFTAAKSLMHTTSVDCYSAFAPFLANVMCCPQLAATLTILVGQSSQGAASNLNEICSVRASILTEASCPVKDVFEFESTLESSKLLRACERIDPVKECCDAVCQNAMLEAATKIALKTSDVLAQQLTATDHSSRIDDCKRVVARWLVSKLDPFLAKEILRGLSNCDINKACPLLFPELKLVEKSCRDGITNETACCNSMESYVSHLQKQSFITNLQALDCASSLGMKLRKLNITKNIYSLCQISLKDFSLQAIGSQESGCLLPSLPSDATFDKFTGVSFLCDLNDNIPAPWPSSLQMPTSSCNKTIKIPALPAATSAQSGLNSEGLNLFKTSALVAFLSIIS